MGNYAFSSCIKLQSASFPSLSFIPVNAFNNCSVLVSAYFSIASVIQTSAFRNCYTLRDASFPNVAVISDSAFMSCRGLSTISFPNLTSIGNGVFYWCSKLESLYLLASSVASLNTGTYTFAGTPIINSSYLGYYGSIYVPSSLYETYISATNWAAYSQRFVSYAE